MLVMQRIDILQYYIPYEGIVKTIEQPKWIVLLGFARKTIVVNSTYLFLVGWVEVAKLKPNKKNSSPAG